MQKSGSSSLVCAQPKGQAQKQTQQLNTGSRPAQGTSAKADAAAKSLFASSLKGQRQQVQPWSSNWKIPGYPKPKPVTPQPSKKCRKVGPRQQANLGHTRPNGQAQKQTQQVNPRSRPAQRTSAKADTAASPAKGQAQKQTQQLNPGSRPAQRTSAKSRHSS